MVENLENPEWLKVNNGALLEEIADVFGLDHEEWKLVHDVKMMGSSRVTHFFDSALQSLKDNRLIPILVLSRNDEDKSNKIMMHRVKTTDTMIPVGVVVTDYDMDPKEQDLCEICNLKVYRLRNRVAPSAMLISEQLLTRAEEAARLSNRESLERGQKPKVQRRNRDRTKIIMDILSNVQFMKGASITQLIYRCNLNYKYAKSILGDLISRELLKITTYENQTRKYELTDRGRNALERLRITETL